MREKIIKNRKYILMVLGILILVTFNIGMRYLATRPRYKTLPEVTLRNKEPNKSGYAVMVKTGDSYVEYASEDGKWPSEEDYEFKEAKCIDNEGRLVESAVTFESGKVTLKTNKTIYCTLYFDENASLEITNVTVDNSVPHQVTLTVSIKGGSGKYTYLVENSCKVCDKPSTSCGGEISYNENIITIGNLSYCNYAHDFVVKVTDTNERTAEYKITNVSVKKFSNEPVTCTSCFSAET